MLQNVIAYKNYRDDCSDNESGKANIGMVTYYSRLIKYSSTKRTNIQDI